MAVQIYQNQTAFEVIVPTADSSISLYPNEYVGGSYYAHIPELVNVTNQNIDPLDVKYFYPESGEAGTSLNGFDTATGTLPIQVDVVGTSFNVSIQPISGLDISDGQVVRTLNTLTDTVTITGQAGISVDVNVGNNSIDITNTQLGLTDVHATAPLYLTLGEGNVSLEGSIAITPTDDGGAVALQTGSPTYQNDFAALRSLFLKSLADVDPFLRVYSSTDGLLTSLDSEGALYTQDIVANTVSSEVFHIHETIGYDGTTYTVGGSRILLESGTLGLSYFDIPFDVLDTITLGKSTVTPGNIGNIQGLQESAYVNPFVDLYTIPDQTVPLIRLNSGYPSDTVNGNVFLDVVDNDGLSLIKLHGDGVVTAKTLEADTIDVTTVFAENIFSSTLYVVGPDTIVMTTSGGPQTIIADCSNGPVVVQLPDLTAFDKSLKVTALKSDTSNNALSFVNGPNSTINGSPVSVSIVDQYAGKTITSAGINWYITSTVG